MSIGRLRRNLDLGLIARLKAGIRHRPKPMTRTDIPRFADTYRGMRRATARQARREQLLAKRAAT